MTILWFWSPGSMGEQSSAENAASLTPVTVGQEMFRAYCASCHGLDGRGNGPASAALKTQPPDLTRLSQSHGGTFPSDLVTNVIEGERVIVSHGSREMPVWGHAFRNVNSDERMAKLKVQNLTAYIESIQRH